jgi:hypothetical protein
MIPVSPASQPWRRKPWRERERDKAYQGEEDQISTRNQAFHEGELKSPWRGPRSRVPCKRQKDLELETVLERGSRVSFEDMFNWSDRSSLTHRQVVQNLTTTSLGKI